MYAVRIRNRKRTAPEVHTTLHDLITDINWGPFEVRNV